MEKLEITWSETIANVNSSQSKTEKMISVMAGIVFDAICAILFICSARIMLGDVYYWGAFGDGELIKVILLAFTVSAVMEIGLYKGKKLGFIMRLGILVIGLLYALIKLIGEDGEDIIEGFIKMASYYIEDWNEYYNSMWYVGGGRISYISDAMSYITSVILLVFLWWAKLSRENLVMVVIPTLVFILELMVGYSPEYGGIVLMFVAILVSNASSWKIPSFKKSVVHNNAKKSVFSHFSWVIVIALTFVFSGFIEFIGQEAAIDMVRNADDFKYYCNELIDKFEQSSLWDIFEGGDDTRKEKITNDSPDYKDVPVLNLSMVSRPEWNIYLKGFYAGEYKDGVWKKNVADFEDACQEDEYQGILMAQNLEELPIKNIKRYVVNGNDKLMVFGRQIEITYYQNSEKLYVPYCSFFDEQQELEGDFCYVMPDGFSGKMTAYMWNYEYVLEDYLSRFENVVKDQWEIWYENYAKEKYLNVPENMENVKAVADEISKWPIASDYNLHYSENETRMFLAKCVAKWMEENTSYSLEPPVLPIGDDPIEYFLGESKIGYCMHYAGAATLILRELGVPARYASGYFVSNSNISLVDSGYGCDVLDSDAHAWVEIYLNGFGWVPVEVTKGYNADIKDWNPNEEESTEQTTTKPDITTKPSETTTQDKPSESETTKPIESVTTKPDDVIGENDDDNEKKGVSAKTIILVMFGAIVVGLIIMLVYKFRVEYKNRLLNAIRRKKTLLAIRMINRRIYKRARLTGKIIKFNPRDDEYEQSLKKHYPEISKEDWEKYMDIVKAAAFSNRDFDVWEMEFCHEIYNKITGRNKK